MEEILNTIKEDGRVNIIRILTSAGPRVTRPMHTFKKKDTFAPRFVPKGNSMFIANIFTMSIPCDDGSAVFDMAEHLNGGIMNITYKKTDFAIPSLSVIAGMGTTVVFDLQKKELACQRRFCDIGCRDTVLHDEISDIAADARSCLITTKMMSESIPGEPMIGHPLKLMNLNSEFVSDIVHTKKMNIVSNGIVDYHVRLSIPAKYSYGTIEILSATFWNDILIQLVRTDGAWEVMKDNYDASRTPGFVIAKTPDIAMGVSILDWPRGAIAFPPTIMYKEFENVNRWGFYQQLGSSKNNSLKIPGGEYSWKFRFFFGPIWKVQHYINKIQQKKHGNEHEKLYHDNFQDRQSRNRHEYAYDCA